jgi:protein-glutamine gamma-glutamyltransferase
VSAGAHTLTVSPRFERSPAAAERGEPGTASYRVTAIRLATFAALALYGLIRWATLFHPVPTWRLVGLLAVAVAITAAVPPVRAVSLPAAVVLAFVLVMVAFPIAGLPWHWFRHVRIAVSVDRIGTGLQGLAGVLVPYLGANPATRLVIVLGAAVLLLDAAIVIAFAPRTGQRGDARRAGAALPLIALAVVPSTLVRPQLPYLQGLLLFGLLAAFMWGDRIRRGAFGAALTITAIAGIGGAVLAPRLDTHTPWVNYRAWAGTAVRAHVDLFNWNQTYGPLHWPRLGHVVLTVRAQHADYWKAQDLDSFNGYAWQSGPGPAVPIAAPVANKAWSQEIQVTIQGMRTYDVIAAGASGPAALAGSSPAPSLPGGDVEGQSAGTWTSGRLLGPGTSYRVLTHSPDPTPVQLRAAGTAYPWGPLTDYRTLGIPAPQLGVGDFPQVTFAAFHSRARPYIDSASPGSSAGRLLESSPYAAAYALARQLAARASTPYAFVASVERYLSHGFTYNEKPPVRQYPLESFLFRDRIGYCQQFSGAMALLLRMGGLPARAAAGFTTGTSTGTHEWTVTDIDAHAWVEVWFPHYGWVRFDPTPAVAPARGGSAPAPLIKNLPGESAVAPAAPRRDLSPTPAAGIRSRHGGGGGLNLPLVGGLVLALVAASLVARWVLRPAPAGEDLVTELERALARTGRPMPESTTLASLEQRFRSSPGAAGYVRALRLARYGGGGGPPSAHQRRALREQLRFGLGVSGRLRALWALPPRPALPGRRVHGDRSAGRRTGK